MYWVNVRSPAKMVLTENEGGPMIRNGRLVAAGPEVTEGWGKSPSVCDAGLVAVSGAFSEAIVCAVVS